MRYLCGQKDLLLRVADTTSIPDVLSSHSSVTVDWWTAPEHGFQIYKDMHLVVLTIVLASNGHSELPRSLVAASLGGHFSGPARLA